MVVWINSGVYLMVKMITVPTKEHKIEPGW